jgi:hypothetical protein
MPNEKLCQCHRCVGRTTRDRDTGEEVQGVILSTTTWVNHQRQHNIWVSKGKKEKQDAEQEEAVNAIIATTLAKHNEDDPSMNPRLFSSSKSNEPPLVATRGHGTPSIALAESGTFIVP